MPLVRLGNRGEALVYIPSSGGNHGEFIEYGLLDEARPWIERGRVQAFLIDGHGPQGLFNDALSPRRRVARHVAFERYVTAEALPRIRRSAGVPSVVAVGCSYGAFVAANQLFKAHDQVAAACGLGGVYGMWHRHPGFHDDDVYFHTPLEYLPRLEDPRILDAIRATGGIDLYAAERDPWLDHTRRLAAVLRDRRLPHRVSIWPAPADHHERWWRPQFRDFLQHRYGTPG